MKIEQLFENLVEMPMTGYGFVGDDNLHAEIDKGNKSKRTNQVSLFTKTDNHLIKVGKADVEKFFQKTPFNFRIFFVNDAEALDSDIQLNNRILMGKDVFIQWFKEYEFSQKLFKLLFGNQDYKQAVNVVLIGNRGAYNMPLTPWIITHRISHALVEQSNASERLYRKISDLISYIDNRDNINITRIPYYKDNINTFLMRKLGTFASARRGDDSHNNTHLINTHEFIHECFAQYIGKGRVVLNREVIDYVKEDKKRELEKLLIATEKAFKNEFDKLLKRAVGKIGVLA